MQAIIIGGQVKDMRKVSDGPVTFKGWDKFNHCWYYTRHTYATAVYEDGDGARWATLEWGDGTASDLWKLDADGYLTKDAEVAVRL